MKAQNKKIIFKLANLFAWFVRTFVVQAGWQIIPFLFSSCAQIVAPAGGAKDIQPPRAEKYIPDSAATNFNSKTITITFDEYIQLVDLQKELTISPPIRIQPEVKAKGRMLQIDMQDSLKKNTTYVLNFGSSIRDFTESNIKTDFRYIFSTGTLIDTLKLTGTVKDAYDQKTDKGILVMLYESFDDSVPYKTGPSYFAKTNADGTYKISNIRPGTYKAFALKDANGNYRYDVPTESIAFSDTLVKIYKNVKLDFHMFREEPKQQRLLKDFVKGYGSILLAYAKPVKKIAYKPMNSGTKTETFITEYNSRRDTVAVWFPNFSNDSLHFRVTVDEKITDTIRICTCLFEKSKQGRGEIFKLNSTINVSKENPLDLNKDVLLKFNHPIRTINAKGIYLTSNSRKINYTNTTISDEINKNFFFKFPLEQDSSYQLFIAPGTFTDIFDLKNDTIKIDFKPQDEKFYGTLKLNLKIKSKSAYVLELVNEKGIVFDFIGSDKGIFSYQYLPPGSYKLRIIYDQNGDDKWTTGNYFEKKIPEAILYYSGAVTIRSNWDLELDWKVE